MSQNAGLKKPIGIYILAVLFILAPLGNILISFAGAGISNWYEPSVFISLVQTIPSFEWLWLCLLVMTGGLLFRPHKLSWSFAIATLLIILSINFYRMFATIDSNSIDPQYLKVFSVLALICTLGVLVIAFYFRFPYLDRRANWIKNVERYDLSTEVTVAGKKGYTESLSLSGCKVRFSEKVDFAAGQIIEVVLAEVSNQNVKCSVISAEGHELRLEFERHQDVFMTKLKSWMKTKAG